MRTSLDSRRNFLKFFGTTTLGLAVAACAGRAAREEVTAAELALIRRTGTLPIVTWSPSATERDAVLRRKAALAGRLRRRDLERLDVLMRATLKVSGGVGLAAPQVGVSRRIFLVELQSEPRRVVTCVDPRIIERSREMVDGYEGCLSIPKVGGKVSRHTSVTVSYTTLDGKRVTYVSKGWEARIFQHEYDHLDGILYVDRLKGPLLPYEEIRRLRKAEKKPGKQAALDPTATPWAVM